MSGMGDGVDRFDARLLPRQRQHGLHSCDGDLTCLLMTSTGLAHFTVGEKARRHAGMRSPVGINGCSMDMHQSCRTSRKPESRNNDAPERVYSHPGRWAAKENAYNVHIAED